MGSGSRTVNIINSVISNNTSARYPAFYKINNNGTNINFESCTIVGNNATVQDLIYGTSISISNSIIYYNNIENYSYLLMQGEISVNHSNIQINWTGTGNINSDPLFCNYEDNDFHIIR